MLWHRVQVWLKRQKRRLVRKRHSASELARGLAAGVFALLVPVPLIQVPVALLMAWYARGSKVLCLLPLLAFNPGTFEAIVAAEAALGEAVWPGTQAEMGRAVEAARLWQWGRPVSSAWQVVRTWADLPSVWPPLAGGALLAAILASGLTHVLAVGMLWTWRARQWRLRLASSTHRTRQLVVRPRPPLTNQETIRRYVRAPGRFSRASAAGLLVDSQAFRDMLAAIDAARSRVDLETYILRGDRTGRQFQQALLSAARRGVNVRLLYDWVGGFGLGGRFIAELLEAGVQVSVYRPLVLGMPLLLLDKRDHRKILIVDRRVSFTGGLNIADDYASLEEGGGGWRDTHVRLDGEEVAYRLGLLFDYAWRDATPYQAAATVGGRLRASVRRRLHQPFRRRQHVVLEQEGDGREEQQEADGGVPVKVLGNELFRYRRRIHEAYLFAIRQARHHILIENAYFIPDHRIRSALKKAARRGVLVAVAVARENDVAIAAFASRNLYGELLASRVRIFEWPHGMLHAKTAVIDDAWAIVGSYNFDHRSLVHQLEAVAMISDVTFARTLREQTLADLARCHEVTLEEHESRPWHQMFLESMCYKFRHWL